MTPAKLNSELIATVAGEIAVFNFDKETREYLQSSVEFLAVGVGLPANSCTDKPIEKKEGYAVCRSANSGAWEYIPDHRGERIYSTVSGKELTVSELGDYPPQTTPLVPETIFDKWDGSQWITDSASEREAQINEAGRQRETLLAQADSIMADWRTMLMLGEISNADKLKLSAWMAYKSELKAIDVTTAPEINWPEPPAR